MMKKREKYFGIVYGAFEPILYPITNNFEYRPCQSDSIYGFYF